MMQWYRYSQGHAVASQWIAAKSFIWRRFWRAWFFAQRLGQDRGLNKQAPGQGVEKTMVTGEPRCREAATSGLSGAGAEEGGRNGMPILVTK
jgi:hypothetical protein